ncbi:MAG: hypothetical protein WCC12_00555 [Anaerolineales bacterium]
MQSKMIRSLVLTCVILLISMSGCNLGTATPLPPTPQAAQIPVAGQLATATFPPTSVPVTASAAHTLIPAEPRAGKLVYDVESSGTGPERRAPYGDSYDINRLERPFLQDMTYVPDLDISTFVVTSDNDWWYVSVNLVGIDPGSLHVVNYGVELDLDQDGFGDYLIWAQPPYAIQWETIPVRIFQDNNHNTAGLSYGKSDAPLAFDGYELLVFDGSIGGADPDLAWVRATTGSPATVQFAFKRSWSGNVFMLGVLADAGLRDPQKLDYVDRFTLAEAGSPVKENMYYPLKALFAVDNTCREAYGFEPTRYEPQICPVPVAPTKTPGPDAPPETVCLPPISMVCKNGWDYVNCQCK